MDSTLVIKNSYTYCKNLQVIKNQVLRACSQGDGLVGKDHRSSPTATHKEDTQITSRASNLLHHAHHTCMIRDLQTLTQVFLNYIITQQHNSHITSSYLKTITENQVYFLQ